MGGALVPCTGNTMQCCEPEETISKREQTNSRNDAQFVAFDTPITPRTPTTPRSPRSGTMRSITEQAIHEQNKISKETQEGTIVKICTWSSLSNSCIQEKGIGYCDSKYLSWEQHRKKLFFDILSNELSDNDIISFQNVDCSDELSNYYSQKNYELLFEQRNGMSSGLSVVVCKDKFEVVFPYNRLEFDGLSSVNKDNAYFLTHDIAIIVILYHKFTKKRILIANTNCDEKRGHELRQLLQLNALCNAVDRLSEENKVDFVFLNGNFGCDPNSISYEYMLKGYAEMELLVDDYKTEKSKMEKRNKNFKIYEPKNDDNKCTVISNNEQLTTVLNESDIFKTVDLEENMDNRTKLEHELNVKSVYKSFIGNEPEFTVNTPYIKDCLDYIFVKSNSMITGVETANRAKKFIPNRYFPSDHYYITTSINLKPPVNDTLRQMRESIFAS